MVRAKFFISASMAVVFLFVNAASATPSAKSIKSFLKGFRKVASPVKTPAGFVKTMGYAVHDRTPFASEMLDVPGGGLTRGCALIYDHEHKPMCLIVSTRKIVDEETSDSHMFRFDLAGKLEKAIFGTAKIKDGQGVHGSGKPVEMPVDRPDIAAEATDELAFWLSGKYKAAAKTAAPAAAAAPAAN